MVFKGPMLQTLEQASWEDSGRAVWGKTQKFISWTGSWLIRMSSPCSGSGYTAGPPIFYVYNLSIVLTSLMIFFFLKIQELALQGHCQEPSQRLSKLLVNSEPSEFHEHFIFRVLLPGGCLEAGPCLLRQPCR